MITLPSDNSQAEAHESWKLAAAIWVDAAPGGGPESGADLLEDNDNDGSEYDYIQTVVNSGEHCMVEHQGKLKFSVLNIEIRNIYSLGFFFFFLI